MTKYLLATIPLFFSGCYFTFNAAMCDQLASDPNAVMPEECRNYNEDEADKAFFKNKIEVEIDGEDVSYDKEDEKEKE